MMTRCASDCAVQRYYSSIMGRFLTPDPGDADLVHPQSFNRYTYAYGDPINSVDTAGRLAVCADDFLSSGAGGGVYPCYDPLGHIQVGISLHTVAEYDDMYGDPHCGGRGYSFLPNGHPYCAPDEGGGQASPAKPCTDWGCMPPAYARAVQALTLNKNCFDLFGNDKTRQAAWNPVTVLTNLAVTRKFAHGSINFDYTGLIESLRFNFVEFCQVRAEHDVVAAD